MSGLRELLIKYGIRPVHDRGQNFLVSDDILNAVVQAAEVKSGDHVLEIGPGPGVLTDKLLDCGASVVAVEIDGRLQQLLTERFDGKDFVLVAGDALEQSLESLSVMFTASDKAYKVVANIPYGITSKLILKLLRENPRPESITIMVQKEVADRIVAAPGDLSRLAIAVQCLGQPRKIRNVSKGAFQPPPKVDSAILRIDVERAPAIADWPDRRVESFLEFVGRVFSSPRKNMSNLLSAEAGGKSQAGALLASIGVNPQARPATLSVDEWIKLFVQLKIR